MATLELNGKSLATQTSSAEPVIASTVTGGAGLSGMTSLGTVTAGNLSNTAIVYPAGHVVQVVNNIYNSSSSDSNTSGTLVRFGVSSTYHWKGTINNVGASNHVIVIMSFCFEMYKASTGVAGGGCGIMRDTDGAGTGLTTILEPKTHSNWIDISASNTMDMYDQKTLHFVDTSPATGTNVYYLAGKQHSSSALYVHSTSAFEPFSCTLMEIQR